MTAFIKQNGTSVAEFIVSQKFSPEEIEANHKIIQRFVKLYHENSVQTWSNTHWRGVKVFKAPTDLWIYQELIEHIRPDLIIETGTAMGGSALFLRDMLNVIFPHGHVISVDIRNDILSPRAMVDGITFINKSSTSVETIAQIKKYIDDAYVKRVMVILDSYHTEDHVFNELELYGPLVTKGSALIVEDTNTPGPSEAIDRWRPDHPEFKMDTMCEKFMLTFNRGGYFERVA